MEDRKFDLSPRIESVRDKKFTTEVVQFTAEEIYDHFQENIGLIKAQLGVAKDLVNAQQLEIAETIWRSQIVLLASAVDFYMHEITKFGLCQIYYKNWTITEKYNKLMIRMEYVNIALDSSDEIDWFLDYINDLYKADTMLSSDFIKDQFNLLGLELKEVADKAFYKRGATENTKNKFKRRINELYRRRNAVAHQLDRAHEDASTTEITEILVEEFLVDIEKIIKAIHQAVSEKEHVT